MRKQPRFLSTLACLCLAACASLEPRPELPADAAVTLPDAGGAVTALDDLLAGAERSHPEQSGFRLLPDGHEAFAIRAQSANLAGRSLDVQTYIWHDDLTGVYLAQRLLQAADRGVKVRLLVDDIDARGKNFSFAALDAHPHIDVRLFNPFSSRDGTMALMFEAMGSFSRINRRMHNKSWIADNRIAVVGGRNLGDEYFGASGEVNFVDLDFAMVGPIVRDASASFDRYWNSPSAYPISLLSAGDVTEANLAALRDKLTAHAAQAETSRYADELRRSDTLSRLAAGDRSLQWSARYRFVADDPAKVLGQGTGTAGSEVLAVLQPALDAATNQISIISPYFVPGERGTQGLVRLAGTDRSVRVLTNSLAANDVAAVYGGYSESREDLLRGGVQLWELKPLGGGEVDSSLFGSSGASLHTKALAIDRRIAFVGSYNLDPRSTSLNSEQGVFVEDAGLAQQLEDIFAQQSAGARAWSVSLEDGQLFWSDGATKTDETPQASWGRRFQAWLARVLPVNSQL